MNQKLVIIGAGGHAKVVASMAQVAGCQVLGFLDDCITGDVFGLPILGTLQNADRYKENCRFIIGIGNNGIRQKIAGMQNVSWATVIHPSAVVAPCVEIGVGTVVMPSAVINVGATIGRHCIINTAAVVEHDNTIGDYVHISPHATLCGTVNIEALCHIGAGAVIKNNISVCRGCIVGASAAVVKNITAAGTYVGIPARRGK